MLVATAERQKSLAKAAVVEAALCREELRVAQEQIACDRAKLAQDRREMEQKFEEECQKRVKAEVAQATAEERRKLELREEDVASLTRACNASHCTTCLTEPPNVLFLPCRHLAVCKACFDRQQEHDDSDHLYTHCGMCQERVYDHIVCYVQQGQNT
uniref:Zinc finger protein n=1 Tax=Pyropia haitanensis TaxID=1262161 RepID=A0A1P8NW17_PYRHA|nr:zinc finger protein [Neoporphyra haitanensis]